MINIDINHLNSLLISFYTLTKIKIVVYNEDFDKILSYPEKDGAFCEFMQRNYFTDGECEKCAKNFCEQCKITKDIYIGSCHAGLVEAVFPLMSENNILGYIMFGQTSLCGTRKELKNTVLAALSNVALQNENEIPLNKILLKSKKEIYSATQILKTIANYIIIKNYLSRKKAFIIEQLYNYIEENIYGKITINKICKNLLISKTKLYAVIKSEFPKGLNYYITDKKMKITKELLKTSNKSLDEIAQQLSIKNGNYLSKCFKKIYGISPTYYKKHNR